MLKRGDRLLYLSVMPLRTDHIDERCADIVDQQRRGIATHALFIMKFQPEGTPPVNKAAAQCEIFDEYRKRLDQAGARYGVLVQATLGHIVVPYEPYPFTSATSLLNGTEMVTTCCPLDPAFGDYLKEQMRILATHKPNLVMLDDDLGLLYRETKGCACKYHMAEFNRRAGTAMTREELCAHTVGTSDEDKHYTDIYVETQRHGLLTIVRKMREGLDEVDPTIQGIVSGVYVSTFCEFSDELATAFAGKGNPRILRLNGAPYAMDGPRTFSENAYRAATLIENTKDRIDVFLAETDTCPQNRYSTSASLLHAHFTSSVLEGATGAKHWLTRTGDTYEPLSGKAYRDILAKYAPFYEVLCEYVKDLRPFGCRIPLTTVQNYGFLPATSGARRSCWSTNFLERMGFPVYFSNEDGGAVFLDEYSVNGFDDAQIRSFMAETLVLSAGAADTLHKRGFSNAVGVSVGEWGDTVATNECIGENTVACQYNKKMLTPLSDKTEVLSTVACYNAKTEKYQTICPAVTRTGNPFGGETIVFGGSPDMPYLYFTAYSLLNETRKQQFVNVLKRGGHLPLYYPDDGEIYLRAGRLPNGEKMAVLFNLGLDTLPDIPLVSENAVTAVETLNPDGTRTPCTFSLLGEKLIVEQPLAPLLPVVLFIK